MPKNRPDLGTYAYRKARAFVLADSDTCVWCGHLGADAVDHVVPVSRGGDPSDVNNLRPIHGVRGCPTCGRKCNSEKGNKLLSERDALVTSRDWYRN